MRKAADLFVSAERQCVLIPQQGYALALDFLDDREVLVEQLVRRELFSRSLAYLLVPLYVVVVGFIEERQFRVGVYLRTDIACAESHVDSRIADVERRPGAYHDSDKQQREHSGKNAPQ